MPNGNTFITEAVTGRLSEVSYDKEVVWQRMTTAWTGRAIKYPRDFAGGVTAPHAGAPLARGLQCTSPVRPGGTPEVRYTIASSCRVSLGVFDAAGRVVAELAQGCQTAGSYTVDIVLPQRMGAAGVYFVQLAAGTADGRHSLERAKLVLAD